MFNYVYLCSSMFIYVHLCLSIFNYVYLCSSMLNYLKLCSMFIYVYLCSSIIVVQWKPTLTKKIGAWGSHLPRKFFESYQLLCWRVPEMVLWCILNTGLQGDFVKAMAKSGFQNPNPSVCSNCVYNVFMESQCEPGHVPWLLCSLVLWPLCFVSGS